MRIITKSNNVSFGQLFCERNDNGILVVNGSFSPNAENLSDSRMLLIGLNVCSANLSGAILVHKEKSFLLDIRDNYYAFSFMLFETFKHEETDEYYVELYSNFCAMNGSQCI